MKVSQKLKDSKGNIFNKSNETPNTQKQIIEGVLVQKSKQDSS